MEYNRSDRKQKWTIMMYMRDFDLMTVFAYALRASSNLTAENLKKILAKMESEGLYKPRKGTSVFTGQFKTIQVAWYMFGYYDNSGRRGVAKRIVFSPLGNLLLDNLKDKARIKRIFEAMLFSDPFPQPFSQMSSRFNIYPFRLLFQLLRDPRLNGRLYEDEIFDLCVFCKTIDRSSYEDLVSDILALRKRSGVDKFTEFKKNESVLGLACHEVRYLAGMLESAGITKTQNDDGGHVIGTFEYGNGTAHRSYRRDYLVLNPELEQLTDTLLNAYSFDEKPFPESDEPYLEGEILVKFYSFYPKELLENIKLSEQPRQASIVSEMLSIASAVNSFSHNDVDHGDNLFEFSLESAMNLFQDVHAEHVGGSGKTDVECIFSPDNSATIKFDVEAKSRKSKLSVLDTPRIKLHREEAHSLFTIIVAPDFSYGVLNDILGDASVLIQSATLSNYLYQYILATGPSISFKELYQMIVNNEGKNISAIVNKYVYDHFGHGYADLSINSKNN